MTQPVSRPNRKPFEDHLILNPSLPPVPYKDAAEATGGGLLPVSASELIGKKFVIYHAKPFNSSFENGGIAYFCKIRIDGDDELKTVVIGGKACVDFLHTYALAGIVNPLEVTLKMADVEAGKPAYYIFE